MTMIQATGERSKRSIERLSNLPLYRHVPVAEEHWTYLGVHFVDKAGKTTFWVWKVLALGLRDAAYIYTRINRPIMAHLRRQGIRSLIYIGDCSVV